MKKFKINVNGQEHSLSCHEDTPLLWVLRDHLGLTGTKFGCGIGHCGACTVHVDGHPTRSCLLPVSSIVQERITTIEGVGREQLHPIQQAWLDLQVPQCGYCQSGQIMSAISLFENQEQPSERDTEQAMQGNLCRCGTYDRIKKAIAQAYQSRSPENQMS